MTNPANLPTTRTEKITLRFEDNSSKTYRPDYAFVAMGFVGAGGMLCVEVVNDIENRDSLQEQTLAHFLSLTDREMLSRAIKRLVDGRVSNPTHRVDFD